MAIARSGATFGKAARMRCASAGWPERACQLASICASRKFGSAMSASATRYSRAGGIGAVADIGDQRGMQREDAAEARILDIGTQRGQRGIDPAIALLRPGLQQRLQQLRHALARQGMETLLGGAPASRLDVYVGEHKLRHLVVRQLPGQLDRFRTARIDAGDERLEDQFLIARRLRRPLSADSLAAVAKSPSANAKRPAR